MSNYRCEACGDQSVTRKMIKYNPYCFTCQAIYNNLNQPHKMALFMNEMLNRKFGVTPEKIKKNMQLSYWRDKFDQVIM